MYNVFNARITINLYLFILSIISYALYNLLSLSIRVDFVMISIYFFSIFYIFSPNIFVVMLLGIINDINYSEILGLTSIQYAVLWAIARDNESTLNAQRFNIVWVTFAIFICVSFIIKAAVGRADMLMLFTDKTYVCVMIATIAFYPLLHQIYSSVFLQNEIR